MFESIISPSNDSSSETAGMLHLDQYILLLVSFHNKECLKIAMPMKLTFGRWKQEIVMVRASEQLGSSAVSHSEELQMCESLSLCEEGFLQTSPTSELLLLRL